MADGKSSGIAAIEEFTISRIYDAPRDLVWKSFTEPERMKQWWGPKGFTVFHFNMDFRPGGINHYGMRGPDGSAMWGKFVYREIVPPERIVLINSFSNEAGEITTHPMAPTWPREMHSTFLLEDMGGGKTKVTIRWVPFNATEQEIKTFDAGRDSMRMGWTGTLDQLGGYLARA